MALNYELARQNMVENQVRTWDVLDSRVLDVLSAVHREDFVPPAHRALAFADTSLPIGHGEVMMKPVVEGRMLQAIAVRPIERVLEIGTGTGFITACLARLGTSVVSLERHADLAEQARATLHATGVGNVRIEHVDAVNDFNTDERFDAIVVTGAVYTLPERFRNWLAPGGRLFAVVGRSPAMQGVVFSRSESGWAETSAFETDLPYLAHAQPPKEFNL